MSTIVPPIIEVNKPQVIKFVAIISRDDKPLYLQSFEPEIPENASNFLKYNFLAHMSLDIFASPASLNLREHQRVSDNNALLLFIQDGITVYGYETNTNLKIIVGLGLEVENAKTEEEGEDSSRAAVSEKEDKTATEAASAGAATENIQAQPEQRKSTEESSKQKTKPAPKSASGTSKPRSLDNVFSQIHKSYLKIICNPFTNLTGDNDKALQSPTFDSAIKKIVEAYN